ncbi:uncharacterized protein LOC119362764 isoform X2 [Triticum dicoccoides]|uniref:uncharacterized protein LOC119334469 isoform X2 n=1 Tax=Triticum dicoccoides TaxID=85692 RepID=UPI00188F9DBB|nr:uncharacterized protein LOC119334469 isoform X2 [Triticum dicoccoides]XP_037483920.1 uncharacterized protein LOC119362764 isoform X2 [Triticum dicoccoides]
MAFLHSNAVRTTPWKGHHDQEQDDALEGSPTAAATVWSSPLTGIWTWRSAMEGLELVMEGPSSLFPSLHSVGWLDGRPPLVRLCFFHRCSPPTIVPETLCQARKV